MGVVVALLLNFGEAQGQNDQNGKGQPRQGGGGRQGGFDPAQFKQRMLERYRERLEIIDDAEWKAVQPLIQGVLDARGSLGRRRRGGSGSGRNGGQAPPAEAGGRGVTGRTNAAADELQKAIEARLPASEMKAALSKYIEYRKVKKLDLEKAQEALRAVLTSRQEAIAMLSGLL